MTHSTTLFHIQANENGIPKNVPHTGKKHYEFLDKNQANKFFDDLRHNNPETKFRLVTCKSIYSFTDWK